MKYLIRNLDFFISISSSTSSGQCVIAKKCLSLVSIEESCNTANTMISYSLKIEKRDKTNRSYNINSQNIKDICKNFINEGKFSLSLLNPNHLILITTNNIDKLKSFAQIINSIKLNDITNENSNNPWSSEKDGVVFNKKPRASLFDKGEMLKKTVTINDKMQIFKSMKFPANITTLNINCMTKTIDLNWKQFNHLSILNIDNNKLGYLSESLSNLKSLVVLSVKNNKLTFIWPSLFNTLCHLECLDLRHNKLVSIPSTIGSLKSLKILLLDNNEINYLPVSLSYITTLMELSVSNNSLNILPYELTLRRIDKVDISNNVFAYPSLKLRPKYGPAKLESIVYHFQCNLSNNNGNPFNHVNLIHFVCIGCHKKIVNDNLLYFFNLPSSNISTCLSSNILSSTTSTSQNLFPFNGYFCSITCYNSNKDTR